MTKWFNILVRWVVVSSANPQEISLTIKGVLVGLVPYGIALIGLTHVSVGADQLNTFIDGIATLVQDLLGIVSVSMAIVGLCRKIWLTIKVHQQTTGTIPQQ